jgi:hypothetical protein
MAEKFVADTATLRRIALLSLRVMQDNQSIGTEMREITKAIDELKKDSVLGIPFSAAHVARLGLLIERLTPRRSQRAAHQVVENAVLAELRELAQVLREQGAT